MDRISMICHMYGWGVPAILTLVALLTHSIEADELTSVCLPGKFYIIQNKGHIETAFMGSAEPMKFEILSGVAPWLSEDGWPAQKIPRVQTYFPKMKAGLQTQGRLNIWTEDLKAFFLSWKLVEI